MNERLEFSLYKTCCLRYLFPENGIGFRFLCTDGCMLWGLVNRLIAYYRLLTLWVLTLYENVWNSICNFAIAVALLVLLIEMIES